MRLKVVPPDLRPWQGFLPSTLKPVMSGGTNRSGPVLPRLERMASGSRRLNLTPWL